MELTEEEKEEPTSERDNQGVLLNHSLAMLWFLAGDAQQVRPWQRSASRESQQRHSNTVTHVPCWGFSVVTGSTGEAENLPKNAVMVIRKMIDSNITTILLQKSFFCITI